MDLEAKIGPFLPEEIFDFLSKTGKTGVIIVNTSEGEGKIFLKEGKPVHGEYKEKTGLESIYDMLIVREGSVSFISGEETDKETVKFGGENIKEQVERRRKVLSDLLDKLPPFNTVLVKLPVSGDVSIRKTDWKVMMLIDGKRTIEEIIKDSPLDMVETCQTLEYLLSKKLIIGRESLSENLKIYEEYFRKVMKEFGDGGIGKEAWGEIMKSVFNEVFGDDASFFTIMPEFSISDDVFSELSLPELEEKFEKVKEMLYNKSVEEFGTMLARKKWNMVNS